MVLESNALYCVENICICENGERAQGEDCLEHEGNFCAACLPDYRFVAGDNPGETRCEPCPPGFGVDSEGTCSLRVCDCEDGAPTEGLECPNNGATHCATCNKGFHLDVDEATVRSEKIGRLCV